MHHKCPYCAQPIIRDDNTMGRTVTCPNCGRPSEVPEGSSRTGGGPIWAIGVVVLLAAFLVFRM